MIWNGDKSKDQMCIRDSLKAKRIVVGNYFVVPIGYLYKAIVWHGKDVYKRQIIKRRSHNMVRAVSQDKQGRIWIGTDQDLSLIHILPSMSEVVPTMVYSIFICANIDQKTKKYSVLFILFFFMVYLCVL